MKDVQRRRIRDESLLDALREDLESLRKDFASLTSNGVATAADSTHKLVNRAMASAKDITDSARAQTEAAQERVEQVAADRPWTTIGTSLVVGMVLGKVISWMLRR